MKPNYGHLAKTTFPETYFWPRRPFSPTVSAFSICPSALQPNPGERLKDEPLSDTYDGKCIYWRRIGWIMLVYGLMVKAANARIGFILSLSATLFLIEVLAGMPIGIYCANEDCSSVGSSVVLQDVKGLFLMRSLVVVVFEVCIFACAIRFFESTVREVAYAIILVSVVSIPLGQMLGLEFSIPLLLEAIFISSVAACLAMVLARKSN